MTARQSRKGTTFTAKRTILLSHPRAQQQQQVPEPIPEPQFVDEDDVFSDTDSEDHEGEVDDEDEEKDGASSDFHFYSLAHRPCRACRRGPNSCRELHGNT